MSDATLRVEWQRVMQPKTTFDGKSSKSSFWLHHQKVVFKINPRAEW